ncbi:MAG: RIP metalloprotease RseP [Bacteroidales bacterium]|nr:RIP metalloprotease RseP [Bacteroidales bacterium]
MKLLALLLSLSFLVITHEFGHYCFARLFKCRVRRFYLFFNWKFSILKAKKFDGKWHFLWFNATTPKEWEEKEPDNTLWGIGWIPLGGYCDIAGMIDETKSAEDMESEPQPWEYRSKKAWQRLCIISGGVLVNFLSALVIYAAIFAHWGQDELPMRNATLGYDYHQILIDEGFKNGDMILAIDNFKVSDTTAIEEVINKLLLSNPKNVTVLRTQQLSDTFFVENPTENDTTVIVENHDTSVIVDIAMSGKLLEKIGKENPKYLMLLRTPFIVKDFVAGSVAEKAGIQIGDSVVSINGEATPSFSEITEALQDNADKDITVGLYRNDTLMQVPLHIGSNGKLGVQCEDDIAKLFPNGINHIDYNIFQAIPAGIKYGCQTLVVYVSSLKILFTKSGASQLGGFGTIASVFPKEWNWQRFWTMTAFLAIILAFMNIIPIPGLDGGHIVFTLWEMITRRKPSEKFLERAQTVGMILLFALLIVANGNDLLRWLSGKF